MQSTRILTTVTLLALVSSGCDTLFGPDEDPASIVVQADRYTIDWVGETAVLEAEVRNEDGDLLSNPSIEWMVRDSIVASVDEAGVLTGRANGRTWVVGRAGGVADSALFTVESPVPCLPTGDLAVPDTVNDRIVAGECGPEQRYTEVWRLEVTETKTLTIDLVSGDFNTFLVLLDGSGQLVSSDNDGGVAFNSRLLTTLEPDEYFVLVMPYTIGAGGDYQLSTIEGAHPSPCPARATLAFPDTVTGTTTPDGSCDYEGYYIDVWRLELSDSTLVTVELVGDGFGMYAAVTDTLGRFVFSGGNGPSDGGWLETTLAPGTYDIWAGARERGVTGSYTLKVARGPASLYCPTTGTVAIGGSVTGSLDASDCFVWYAPSDGWELMVSDTTELSLAVNAPDSNFPAILLADSTGELVSTAYQEVARYARMDTTLAPGRYRVWIQSATLEPGDYRLSVVEAGTIGACEPQGAAAVDSVHEGALSTTDCALIDGRYTDVWSLQLDSTTTATIDLTTDKFDAYLIVADTTGATLARDDDSGDGLNASLTLELEPGMYHLWATSYLAHAIGGYQLGIARAASASVAPDGHGLEAGSEKDRATLPRLDTGFEAGGVHRLRPAASPTWLEALSTETARPDGGAGEDGGRKR